MPSLLEIAHGLRDCERRFRRFVRRRFRQLAPGAPRRPVLPVAQAGPRVHLPRRAIRALALAPVRRFAAGFLSVRAFITSVLSPLVNRLDPNVVAHQDVAERRGQLQFIGQTIVEDLESARQTASRAEVAPDWVSGRLHLVYFTDGSCRADAAIGQPSTDGFAVVHKIPGTRARGWMEESWDTARCYNPLQVEMLAQAEAMNLALQDLEQHDLRNVVVQIFTDSQNSLSFIRSGISDNWYTGSFAQDLVRPILIEMAHLSERLHQRGCTLQVRWVKRSTNTKNYQADAQAYSAHHDEHAILSPRGFATRNLDDEIEWVAERWPKRCQDQMDPWNHEVYRAELVARVIELRRMAITMAPEPLSLELQLELNRKDNLVGYLLD